jgi:YD repeat-containing protein
MSSPLTENHMKMKSLLLAASFLLALSSQAQYYYKDIIGTKETSGLIKSYRNHRVSRVVLASYDAENTRSEDFYVEQQFSPAAQTLRTITRSGLTNESVLISYVDAAGNVTRTVDSAEMMTSITEYKYNDAGQLVSVVSISADSARSTVQSEEHFWHYNGDKVARMLRIKNKVDTTYVTFRLDPNGNVIEELSMRRGVSSDPVQYYYDEQNRLTDIVRFSDRAGRLLPEYMFTYSDNNQVIQKITVPPNSSDYLIWRYRYNDKGLKVKEAVYNKYKDLTGTIEYTYSFGL